ncbi:MAG TPA: methyltransferase [Alicycliphilus sp.]|nr:methyltransferase [Alicycliphilus sp.]
MSAVTPDKIMHLALGFWGAKTLLSAVELGVFTELAKAPADLPTLQRRLGLHPRAADDFLDALVALGMLGRESGVYRNTTETDLFLDKAKPSYMAGILEMANARLYPFWGSLTEGLKTGEPQNEAKSGGEVFQAIYRDPERLRGFLTAMSGISGGAARAIAEKFPWKEYKSFADVGAAQGMVPVTLAKAHAHLSGIGFDLPVVRPVFEEFVARNGLSSRVRFHEGDFFKDELPKVDVIVMGHILHDWNLHDKRRLVAKAHAALPSGGALIAYDAVIDDDRSHNAFGLLMSLNMLIETRGGKDYTGADCQRWMRDAGFARTRVEPLAGPDAMVIGVK